MKFKCVRQSQHSAYKKIHSIKDIFCDYISKEERPEISDIIFHIIKLFKKRTNQTKSKQQKENNRVKLKSMYLKKEGNQRKSIKAKADYLKENKKMVKKKKAINQEKMKKQLPVS